MPCENGHFTPRRWCFLLLSHSWLSERKGKIGGLWLSEANHGSPRHEVVIFWILSPTLQRQTILEVIEDDFGVGIWYQWCLYGSWSCKETRPDWHFKLMCQKGTFPGPKSFKGTTCCIVIEVGNCPSASCHIFRGAMAGWAMRDRDLTWAS